MYPHYENSVGKYETSSYYEHPIKTCLSLSCALPAELTLLIPSTFVNTHKFPSSFTRADLIFGHFMYLFLFSSTSGTPEKQQPAVLFRKRLGRCKHAEKPCSLDSFLLVRPCSSLKLQKVKGQFSTQHGHTEPRVQIPAWISSGCWHRQQERTQQHGRKTQDTL